MKQASFVWCLVGLLAIDACAQTGIETLVVTGTRNQEKTPGSQHMDAGQLSPGARADAAEWLQGVAGVQADSRSNYAQDTRITLRGFGARAAFGVRGIDLQIDGIPLSMPDGQGQFSGVMLDGVSAIKVITGPVAALYGNGAGGVINLTTSAPEVNRLSLGSTVDEEGLSRHRWVGEWRDAELGVRLQGSQLEADGNRPHARAERDQLGAQVYYRFDNGIQAQWRFDQEDAPLLQDPLGLTETQWQTDPYQLNSGAELFNTRKSIHHQQQAFSLRQERGNQRWQIALWQGERRIRQYLALKGDALASAGGVVDLNRHFQGVNGNYTWDFSLADRPTSFTLGGEWSAMKDARKGFVNDGGVQGDLRRNELNKARNGDTYALLQWHATDSWQWLLGMRRAQVDLKVNDDVVIPGFNADDSGERNFGRTAESLSTRYTLNEHFSFYAATGKGFETPTLTEMAYTNNDQGFNNKLAAAVNRQYEMGADYHNTGITAALTLFGIKTRDELVVDQSVNGRTTYKNAAATDRKGIELKGSYAINQQLDVRAVFNYLDAVYTRGPFASRQLPGIATYNHVVQLTWSPWPNDKLKLGASANYRSRVATSDDNQTKAPAYTTVDIFIAGKVDAFLHAEWWIKLANCTDENYVGSVIVNQTNGRAFEPAGGRNLAAGVNISYEF